MAVGGALATAVAAALDQPWGRRRRDGPARKVSWRAAGFRPPPCEGIAAMPRWRWRRSEVGGAGEIQSSGSLSVSMKADGADLAFAPLGGCGCFSTAMLVEVWFALSRQCG